MTFKQRLRFYLTGFVIGLLALMVILNKKGCKGVNTIKVEQIAHNKWNINSLMHCKLQCAGFKTDSAFIFDLASHSAVNYSASEVHAEPCGKFVIESKAGSVSSYTALVEDCGAESTLLDIKTKDNCGCK